MGLRNYLSRHKRGIRNTALALVALSAVDSATLKRDRIAFPETEKSSLAGRINPLNSLANVPLAAYCGARNISLDLEEIKNSGKSYSRARSAYRTIKGIADTTLDTGLNILLLPYNEVYEALT